MTSRDELQHALEHYFTSDIVEKTFIPLFLDLLKEDEAYHRSLSFGHLTASAWVISQYRDKVLLIHHKKLDRWLQPGGHADGDENLVAVAEKELVEETGLQSFELFSPEIFDLDIHTIPARKNEPEHDHYDVRFLFRSVNDNDIRPNHEVKEVKWVSLKQIPKEYSLQRMALKSRKIFSK